MLSKILSYLIVVFIGRFVLDLYFSGEMAYLIHPRYIIFTLAASIVAIIVGMIGLIFNFKLLKKPTTKSKIFVDILKFLVILILLYLPNYQINPLSSATFSQRSLDLNTLNIDDVKNSELENFIRNTESISLGEWVKSINLNPDLEDYVDKKVKVSGFIFKSEEIPVDSFMVARFVVTCCAVDARPVGLIVDALPEYEQDKWVEIKGKFKTKEINGKEELVIVPEEIKEINVPTQPYIV